MKIADGGSLGVVWTLGNFVTPCRTFSLNLKRLNGPVIGNFQLEVNTVGIAYGDNTLQHVIIRLCDNKLRTVRQQTDE